MRTSDSTGLVTPIYLKTHAALPWPDGERAFYLLGGNGLFLCRDHAYFRSAVRTPSWPSELVPHDESLELRIPRISRRRMERLVGFFARVYASYRSEAAALLVLDRRGHRVRFAIPEQVATVDVGYGERRYAVGVRYDAALPPFADGVVIGDVHSHADMAAYSSAVDQYDEHHRPGLHVVVGRVDREPPEFHCEFVVDGARFRVPTESVLSGYGARRANAPKAWLDRVSVEEHRHSYSSSWDRK